ncbi:hypothetical protein HaLaN_28267 [Haematococcus lacustris]|uniref:Uncharacterized protein n=1 Tax=Haematococcus lacustris TaxID=44745 RepID=A0A6A0AAH3_HAELA|nr:hypothetical protein HaLaN_28267 [Haematococcus lacustris]
MGFTGSCGAGWPDLTLVEAACPWPQLLGSFWPQLLGSFWSWPQLLRSFWPQLLSSCVSQP